VLDSERLEKRLVDDAGVLGLVYEGMEFTFSNVRQFLSLPSMSAAGGAHIFRARRHATLRTYTSGGSFRVKTFLSFLLRPSLVRGI